MSMKLVINVIFIVPLTVRDVAMYIYIYMYGGMTGNINGRL